MNKLNVKTNDTVLVIAGKDKGKKGKIMKAMPGARSRSGREHCDSSHEAPQAGRRRRKDSEGSRDTCIERYARMPQVQ